MGQDREVGEGHQPSERHRRGGWVPSAPEQVDLVYDPSEQRREYRHCEGTVGPSASESDGQLVVQEVGRGVDVRQVRADN